MGSASNVRYSKFSRNGGIQVCTISSLADSKMLDLLDAEVIEACCEKLHVGVSIKAARSGLATLL